MRKILVTIIAGIFSLMMSANLAFSANIPESSDPIKIVINDWTGQHVSTKIAGEVLKKWVITLNMSLQELYQC